MRIPSLSLVVPLALTLACSSRTAADRRCAGDDPCPAGTVCLADGCYRLCTVTADCGSAELFCDSGVCVSVTPPDPTDSPVITSIDGTGSEDGALGHTTHHLRDRLVINGQNFQGASVTLTNGASSYTLTECEAATDTKLVMALPTELQAGTYTLTVANDAGACNSNVSILQGEPGSVSGAAGDVECSGCVDDEDVSSIGWDKLTDLPSGFADGIDHDTTYSGANFALSNQACTGSQKVTGISGTGTVQCADDLTGSGSAAPDLTCTSCVSDAEITDLDWSKLTNVPSGLADGVDNDTTYSGANFALSNQACSGSQKVTGISAAGAVQCADDLTGSGSAAPDLTCTSCVSDAEITDLDWSKLTNVPSGLADGVDNDTTYSGANFALSNQACSGSQKVTGISAAGAVQCADDLGGSLGTTIETSEIAAGSKLTVRQGPVGCGYLLTTSTTCYSVACGVNSEYGNIMFHNCWGGCSQNAPQSCSTTVVGSILQ